MINFTPRDIENLAVVSTWLNESGLTDLRSILWDNKVPCSYKTQRGKEAEVFLVGREDFVFLGQDNRVTQKVFAVDVQMCFSAEPTPVRIFFYEGSRGTIYVHWIDFCNNWFESEKQSKLDTVQLSKIIWSIQWLPHWGLLRPKEDTVIKNEEPSQEEKVLNISKGSINEKDDNHEEEQLSHSNCTRVVGDKIYYYFSQSGAFFRYSSNFEITTWERRRVVLWKWKFERWTDKRGFRSIDPGGLFEINSIRSKASIEVFMRVIAPSIQDNSTQVEKSETSWKVVENSHSEQHDSGTLEVHREHQDHEWDQSFLEQWAQDLMDMIEYASHGTLQQVLELLKEEAQENHDEGLIVQVEKAIAEKLQQESLAQEEPLTEKTDKKPNLEVVIRWWKGGWTWTVIVQKDDKVYELTYVYSTDSVSLEGKGIVYLDCDDINIIKEKVWKAYL